MQGFTNFNFRLHIKFDKVSRESNEVKGTGSWFMFEKYAMDYYYAWFHICSFNCRSKTNFNCRINIKYDKVSEA